MVGRAMGAVFLIGFAGVASAQVLARPGPQATYLTQYRDAVPLGLNPNGTCPLWALMNDARVTTELRATDDQLAKWKVVAKAHQDLRDEYDVKRKVARGELLDKIRQMKAKKEEGTEAYLNADAELGAMEARMHADVVSMGDLADQGVVELLDPKQLARLKEIQLQVDGPNGFERKEVQAALVLSAAQQQAIKVHISQYARQSRKDALVPSGFVPPSRVKPGSPEAEENAKAIEKILVAMLATKVGSMKSIEEVLTVPQRDAYRNRVGKEFEFLGIKNKEDDARPMP